MVFVHYSAGGQAQLDLIKKRYTECMRVVQKYSVVPVSALLCSEEEVTDRGQSWHFLSPFCEVGGPMLQTGPNSTGPPRLFPANVQTIFRPFSDHFPTIFRPFSDHWGSRPEPFSDHFPTIFRPFSDHLGRIFRPFSDHFPTIFRPFSDHSEFRSRRSRPTSTGGTPQARPFPERPPFSHTGSAHGGCCGGGGGLRISSGSSKPFGDPNEMAQQEH